MSTESIDPRYAGLDRWPLPNAVRAMWEAQLAAVAVIEPALDVIAQAADAAAGRLREGGRLVYAGAGTSGRLAMLDGVELTPTFGWPAERIVTLIAGGPRALSQAVEGAEDDEEAARAAVQAACVDHSDVFIAVAASGRTPFTCAALAKARTEGALTVAIANSAGAPLIAIADYPILADTGPEVIAGSTRMKAGTAQKIALNLLSSAIMIALGRVHAGRMIAMRATNAKLRLRAEIMVADLAQVSREAARQALIAAEGEIGAAVLVASGCTPQEAADLLTHHGRLGPALDHLHGRRDGP